MLIVGVLIGTVCTALAAGLIAEWQARHAYPPEPQRITPEHIRPLSDGLAALVRRIRDNQPHRAAEVVAFAEMALNLERRARGLPPMAVPRLAPEDVGPLLRRVKPVDAP